MRGSQSGPVVVAIASQRIAVVPARTGRGSAAGAPPCARMPVALARGSTVEHLTLDQGVPGSNPGAPAKLPLSFGGVLAHARAGSVGPFRTSR